MNEAIRRRGLRSTLSTGCCLANTRVRADRPSHPTVKAGALKFKAMLVGQPVGVVTRVSAALIRRISYDSRRNKACVALSNPCSRF